MPSAALWEDAVDLDAIENDAPTGLATSTLGVVSFLNARPLYDSLQSDDAFKLVPAVPAALLEMLTQGRCDIALLPIVDAWRHTGGLQRVSDACIASDGETMTVRVFSKRPADKIKRLHVDGDSHTSVILAQIIWRELYDRKLEIAAWQPDDSGSLDDVDALLLIGDKVVSDAPPGFGFEVDLGAAWKYLASLPFVFAAWFGPADVDFSALGGVLSAARDRGCEDVRRLAREAAPIHGWPEELAVRYLSETLRFKITDPMIEAMDRFRRLAEKYDLL